MPRKARPVLQEKSLSKGQLRKLNALRKSLGNEIADRAFAEWSASQPEGGASTDPNAQKVSEALTALVISGKIKIPRGGFLLRRGRGRVIVERPE